MVHLQPVNDTVTCSLLGKASSIKLNHNHFLDNRVENFNIFSILRLEYKEAVLHSRFLSDLLSPKGQHGQGEIFLRKFLELVNLPQLDYSFLDHAKVYVEEYVGPISSDGMQGGLIDIVIKIPDDQVIVIENKVDAVDQRHQLIRYKNAYPKAWLLYLTRQGRKPSSISTHEQIRKVMLIDFQCEPKHKCISYEEHIFLWLEFCYLQSTRFPLLRETLHQYISTIKKITNKTIDNQMASEIADTIISSNHYLEGFFTLKANEVVKAVERKLLYKFLDEMEAVAKELHLVSDKDNDFISFGHLAGETEMVYHISNSPFCLTVGFDSWRGDFFTGISYSGEKNEDISDRLSRRFSDLLGNDAKNFKWYYLLYFRNSKLGDEYLATWHEGDYDIWGKVNDGTISKRIRWHFEVFLEGLREINLINQDET